MMFLVELALWTILPILVGLGAGLPVQLKKAVRGLFFLAVNQQMSRLQFLTKLALLGTPVLFLLSVIMGAWFREWAWGTIGMFALACSAFGAAWCGERVEQMVKQLQVGDQKRIEVKHE